MIEEGQPLTFVADFETLPPIDPGEYTGITLRKPPAVLEVGAVDQRARPSAAAARAVASGRRSAGGGRRHDARRPHADASRQASSRCPATRRPRAGDTDDKPEALQNVSIELGAPANPPGFDEELTGASAGDDANVHGRLPGATTRCRSWPARRSTTPSTVKGIRRKELLPLDDEFAKEVSDVETLEALRDRVREDLQRGAEHDAEHAMRHELLSRSWRSRLKVAARRAGRAGNRPAARGVRPPADGTGHRPDEGRASTGTSSASGSATPAAETVRSTLVIDEIARRESIEATDDDVDAEIARFAERAGRTPAAVRARLEKEGALDRIRAGIRREKTMAWLIEKAQRSSHG